MLNGSVVCVTKWCPCTALRYKNECGNYLSIPTLIGIMGHAVCHCTRQAQTALAWGNDSAGNAGVESDSDSDEDADVAANKERKEIEEAREAAEAEARETAEEKRLRLARDVLMKLDAEQREKVSDRCGRWIQFREAWIYPWVLTAYHSSLVLLAISNSRLFFSALLLIVLYQVTTFFASRHVGDQRMSQTAAVVSPFKKQFQ